jgi:hypothetical protein
MSNKKVDWMCGYCGEVIHNKQIADASIKGLSCPVCSDGVSYPEKFVHSFLKCLTIDFEPQKRFNWSQNKIYDFYLPLHNLIIEVHGEQHYERPQRKKEIFKSLEEEQENDLLKYTLAIENSIKKYIVLDARESKKETLIKAIESSGLSKEFDIREIDWDEIHVQSLSSLLKKACDMWNEGVIPEAIYKEIGVSLATTRRYLRDGNKAGLCSYPKLPKTERIREAVRRNVMQLTPEGEFIKEWKAIIDIERALGFNASRVGASCSGRQKFSYGFKWVYKEDYEDYLSGKISIDKLIPKRRTTTKKVVQLDVTGNFIKEWDSLTLAALALDGSVHNISAVCNGRSKTSLDCKWVLAEDYYKNKEVI